MLSPPPIPTSRSTVPRWTVSSTNRATSCRASATPATASSGQAAPTDEAPLTSPTGTRQIVNRAAFRPPGLFLRGISSGGRSLRCGIRGNLHQAEDLVDDDRPECRHGDAAEREVARG